MLAAKRTVSRAGGWSKKVGGGRVEAIECGIRSGKRSNSPQSARKRTRVTSVGIVFPCGETCLQDRTNLPLTQSQGSPPAARAQLFIFFVVDLAHLFSLHTAYEHSPPTKLACGKSSPYMVTQAPPRKNAVTTATRSSVQKAKMVMIALSLT